MNKVYNGARRDAQIESKQAAPPIAPLAKPVAVEREVATGMSQLFRLLEMLDTAIEHLGVKAHSALRPEFPDQKGENMPIQALSPLGAELESFSNRLAAGVNRLHVLAELLEL
jgi:hypothetical protein